MLGKKRSAGEVAEEESKLVAVDAVSLTGSIRGKKDLYDFFTLKLQKCLPPFKECTLGKPVIQFAHLLTCKEFLWDLMIGKKKSFENSRIKVLKVPYYEEVSNRIRSSLTSI